MGLFYNYINYIERKKNIREPSFFEKVIFEKIKEKFNQNPLNWDKLHVSHSNGIREIEKSLNSKLNNNIFNKLNSVKKKILNC